MSRSNVWQYSKKRFAEVKKRIERGEKLREIRKEKLRENKK